MKFLFKILYIFLLFLPITIYANTIYFNGGIKHKTSTKKLLYGPGIMTEIKKNNIRVDTLSLYFKKYNFEFGTGLEPATTNHYGLLYPIFLSIKSDYIFTNKLLFNYAISYRHYLEFYSEQAIRFISTTISAQYSLNQTTFLTCKAELSKLTSPVTKSFYLIGGAFKQNLSDHFFYEIGTYKTFKTKTILHLNSQTAVLTLFYKI